MIGSKVTLTLLEGVRDIPAGIYIGIIVDKMRDFANDGDMYIVRLFSMSASYNDAIVVVSPYQIIQFEWRNDIFEKEQKILGKTT